ncbi:MAG: hypothetical protein WKF62_00435 [Solirubrobacterales bacterium]
MIRKSRAVLAMGLALFVGISGVAIGGTTGADNQVSTVTGQVKPKALDKRQFKRVNLTAGVTTLNEDETADGTVPQQETVEVNIDFDKDIRFDLPAASRCDVDEAELAGTTNAQAEALCGSNSRISSDGDAAARFAGFPNPPFPNNEVSDFIVTAFRGNDGTEVILHAFSPTLGVDNTQVVRGTIEDSPLTGFKKRLAVPDVPPVAGGAGALVRFFATISRDSKTVLARCRAADREFDFRAEFTYADNSMETASDTQGCTRR